MLRPSWIVDTPLPLTVPIGQVAGTELYELRPPGNQEGCRHPWEMTDENGQL